MTNELTARVQHTRFCSQGWSRHTRFEKSMLRAKVSELPIRIIGMTVINTLYTHPQDAILHRSIHISGASSDGLS